MCRAHGIPSATYQYRRSKGLSIRDALRKIDTRGKPQKIDDITYPSITALADAYGKKRATVANRIDHGATPAEAVGLGRMPKKRPGPHKPSRRALPVTVEGRPFSSRSACAKHYGINVGTLIWRLENDWTPEQAVEIEFRPTHPHSGKYAQGMFVRCEGKAYPSIRKLAAAYGKSYKKVRQRIRNYNWSPEQAVDIDSPPKKAPGEDRPDAVAVTIGDTEYPTLTACADAYGIDRSLLWWRLFKADPRWSPEEAVGAVERTRGGGPTKIICHGKT